MFEENFITVSSYITHITRQITGDRINHQQISISPDAFSLGLPCPLIYYINSSHKANKPFVYTKDSEKYARSHKLHKNEEN